MKRVFIKNGTVITPCEENNACIVIEDGVIVDTDFCGEIPEDACVVDASGMYVTPGIVEVHAHGGGGFDFMDLSKEAFAEISKVHIEHGVTSIVPTTVACSLESISEFCSLYRSVLSENMNGMSFLGLHLEGPFISEAMKGAQNLKYIRSPSKYEVDRLMDEAGDIISLCTAAPEIDGTEYMAKKMKKNNITLSVGHSNAVFSDIEKARSLEFSHLTHLYSNTPGVRKINQRVYAGILEAAYYFDDLKIELIGDGRHVPKEVLRLALKIKGADKINITSDAMRAAGTNVTESYLGAVRPENRVIIEDSVAKLPDRSFYAGSIATGDVMLKWLVNECNVSLPDAFKMLSLTPASLVGADNKKGSIESGKDADILLIDKEFMVKRIITKENF